MRSILISGAHQERLDDTFAWVEEPSGALVVISCKGPLKE